MSSMFSVIAPDGQAYGPADEQTLAQWAREGRLNAQSILQDMATNQRVYAGQVPAIAAGFGVAAAPAQPYQQPVGYQQAAAYQQPAGYQQQQTAIPAAFGVGYQQPVGYQQQPLGYASLHAPSNAHTLSSFSVGGMIALSIVTFGLYAFFHFQLMHGKMPRNRLNDPSAGKAIGFHFIPFFNIYWVFFSMLRLVDRVNEQRQMAGLPPANIKVWFFCGLIPYLGIIFHFVFYGMLQGAVNEVVRVTRGPNA